MKAKLKLARNMKITNRHCRRVRIVEKVQDLQHITLPNDFETNYGPTDDLPVYYIVKVEVKVAWFWVTLVSESCDISDGDTRQYIMKRAKELCIKLMGN